MYSTCILHTVCMYVLLSITVCLLVWVFGNTVSFFSSSVPIWEHGVCLCTCWSNVWYSFFSIMYYTAIVYINKLSCLLVNILVCVLDICTLYMQLFAVHVYIHSRLMFALHVLHCVMHELCMS